MKTRAFYTASIAIDLDMVPGAYHTPDDWPVALTRRMTDANSYDPVVTFRLDGTAPYIWSGDAYVRPLAPLDNPKDEVRRRDALTQVIQMASAHAMKTGVGIADAPGGPERIHEMAAALEIVRAIAINQYGVDPDEI